MKSMLFQGAVCAAAMLVLTGGASAQISNSSPNYWTTALERAGGPVGVEGTPPIQQGPIQSGPPTVAAPTQHGPAQHGPAQHAYPSTPLYGTGSFATAAGACDTGDCGTTAGGGVWFGRLGGLILNRTRGNKQWLSVDDADITDRVMTTWDADMEYSGGFEIRGGRTFNCNQNAIELVYWGLFPVTQSQQVFAGVDTVGNLGTALLFDDMLYNGAAVNNLYNNQDTHLLVRSYQFHNVEVNLLNATGCGTLGTWCGTGCGSCGGSGCGSCGNSSLQWNWSTGLRYFQFNEGMTFASDSAAPADNVFTGAPEEIYYDIDVANHLIGMQMGASATYCLGKRISFYGSGKMGVYTAYITHESQIGGSAGVATVNNINSPFNGQAWRVASNGTGAAFLSEFDFAAAWQINNCLRATIGYRVMGVAGVALASEQIPTETFTDILGVDHIDTNGSMLLHGGYASLEFNY